MAADLLSQAEHDELASAILVTTSRELAQKVSDEVDRFLKELSRAEIIRKSLDNYGYILVAETLEEAIETATNCKRTSGNPDEESYDVMTKSGMQVRFSWRIRK